MLLSSSLKPSGLGSRFGGGLLLLPPFFLWSNVMVTRTFAHLAILDAANLPFCGYDEIVDEQ